MWIKRYTHTRIWVIWFAISCLPIQLCAQKKPISYFQGSYQIYSLKEEGLHFKLFDFDVSKRFVKVKYFGNNAEQRYKQWKQAARPQVLCYFAAGFARDWATDQAPLGLCIDRGHVLNRTLDPRMDAFVHISREGKLMALDLDEEKVAGDFDLRNSRDKANYLSRIGPRRNSVFQTQLMYSYRAGAKMGDPKYGKKSSRRFLAICRDSHKKTHHMVIELAASAHLNIAAAKAISALEKKGYQILYLLNQDTGSRNIMKAYDQSGESMYTAPVNLSKATQLLVYYLDNS